MPLPLACKLGRFLEVKAILNSRFEAVGGLVNLTFNHLCEYASAGQELPHRTPLHYACEGKAHESKLVKVVRV